MINVKRFNTSPKVNSIPEKKGRGKSLIYAFILLLIWLFLISLTSCQVSDYSLDKKITESDINRFQNNWSQSIIGIGSAYTSNRDFKALAMTHVENFYGFDFSKVILRLTTTNGSATKTTFEGAVAFLTGNTNDPKSESGFALNPWKDIQWETTGIINDAGKLAITMGHYIFTDTNNNTTEFDYSISFEKNKAGELKIITYDINQTCTPLDGE